MSEWVSDRECACACADEGRGVDDLHAGEGLNDAAQVLLQQSREEVVKVRQDDRVL